MILVIIQARVGSTRLPGKVLREINGESILMHVVNRMKKVMSTDVVVATSINSENDVIEAICKNNNVNCYRGSENDVLDRYYQCATYYGARNDDVIVRITSDCPLIDPEVVNNMINIYMQYHASYMANTWFKGAYPSGFDVELFSYELLCKHHASETDLTKREHVMSSYSPKTKVYMPIKFNFDTESLHLSIDTQADFDLVSAVMGAVPEYSYKAVLTYLESHQELIKNQTPQRLLLVSKLKGGQLGAVPNLITGLNPNNVINGQDVLITGGTGSLGNKLVELILENFKPKRLIIFSRDEFKQSNMQQVWSPKKYPCLRYFLGDIRDYDRLEYAFKGVNIIFHAAALKQVPALEYNPTEAVNTNITGVQNVIRAAIKNNVKQVLGISTDKAVAPVNLYGATKLVMERLLVSANCLAGAGGTVFSVARYGNVFGSRGSVAPVFIEQKDTGVLTVTDERMTRFNVSIIDAAQFVLNLLNYMVGGEVFVPKLPRYDILQLAKLIAPNAEIKITGIRPGEKLHESMIGHGESTKILDCGSFYVLTPFIRDIINVDYDKAYSAFNFTVLDAETTYSSDITNLISDQALQKMINNYTNTLST